MTAESLTDEALARVICVVLDPGGTVMKYGEIVDRVARAIGVNGNRIYGAVGQELQKMKRGGRVALVKGKGAGWRWTGVNDRECGITGVSLSASGAGTLGFSGSTVTAAVINVCSEGDQREATCGEVEIGGQNAGRLSAERAALAARVRELEADNERLRQRIRDQDEELQAHADRAYRETMAADAAARAGARTETDVG